MRDKTMTQKERQYREYGISIDDYMIIFLFVAIQQMTNLTTACIATFSILFFLLSFNAFRKAM